MSAGPIGTHLFSPRDQRTGVSGWTLTVTESGSTMELTQERGAPTRLPTHSDGFVRLSRKLRQLARFGLVSGMVVARSRSGACGRGQAFQP